MSLLKYFTVLFLWLGLAGTIFVTMLTIRPVFAENSRPLRAEAFNVNNAADAPDANLGDGLCETAPGNGQCTLRAAIQEANALPGEDTISLPAGTYTLTREGSPDDSALNGDLDVTDLLSITGDDALDTVIDANGPVLGERVFQVITTRLVLTNLTIRNGTTDGDGGGIASTSGTVELNDCVVAQNYAANYGGGIFSDGGSVYLNRTLISENTGGAGGGILLKPGGLTLIEAQVSENVSSTDGGGILNGGGDLLIVNSSIDNNTGFHGGGIYTLYYNEDAHTTIVNSTISANRARGGGGGIGVNVAGLELYNTTIAGNVANAENEYSFQGGGLFVTPGSLVELQNTILANNTHPDPQVHLPVPDDCFGELQSQDYNLIETLDNCTINGETSHNLTEIDPQLGPLGMNGGTTPTHALLPGSPATDAGNPDGCENHLGVTLSTDQRSYTRPVDGDGDGQAACDIGAYEAQRVSFLPIIWR